jgi:hypothetical protein
MPAPMRDCQHWLAVHCGNARRGAWFGTSHLEHDIGAIARGPEGICAVDPRRSRGAGGAMAIDTGALGRILNYAIPNPESR